MKRLQQAARMALGSAAALGLLAGIPAAAQEPFYFGLNMFGDQVPDGGGADEDAGGDMSGEFDFADGRLCYYLEHYELRGANGVEIHEGVRGENGPLVVRLQMPPDPDEETCLDVDTATLSRIKDNLAGFYVVVLSPVHPDGAIRAQMSD